MKEMKDAKKYIMNGPIEAIPMTYGAYMLQEYQEEAAPEYCNQEGFAMMFYTRQERPHWMHKELFDSTFYLL